MLSSLFFESTQDPSIQWRAYNSVVFIFFLPTKACGADRAIRGPVISRSATAAAASRRRAHSRNLTKCRDAWEAINLVPCSLQTQVRLSRNLLQKEVS